MAKYLFLGFNSLLFLFIGLFTADEVTVKHNLPATVEAGTEFVADFTISKTVALQFGKLQVDLPAGFTAEVVDGKDGQFGTSDAHAKLLWMQFPADPETTVKIKFKVDKAAESGPRSMAIKFLYVIGNEKKTLEVNPHTITVTGGQQSAVTNANTNAANTSSNTNTNTTSGTQTDTSKFNSPNDPGSDISVKRTITKDEASGNYKVEITIRKDAIKGFAKYSDVIPDGLVPSKGEMSGGGSFKYADKKATVIWATLPKDETITATYWLKVTGNFTENPTISGAFSYLENETTRKVNAPDAVVPIIKDAIVTTDTQKNTDTSTTGTTGTNTVAVTNTVTTNTTTPTNTTTVTTNTTVATTTTSTVAETNTTTATGNSGQNNVSGSTVGSGAVVFHVQIGAYKKAPETSYFKDKFSITEAINTDMHEGLTKFLIGKYSEYKETRDYRETVKNKGIQDAFVCAYNSGKRITVQEALMIVKQKWFR